MPVRSVPTALVWFASIPVGPVCGLGYYCIDFRASNEARRKTDNVDASAWGFVVWTNRPPPPVTRPVPTTISRN